MADKLIITYEEYKSAVEKLALEIEKKYQPTVLVGIMRGAAPIIDILSRIFKLPTAYVVIQSYSGDTVQNKQGELIFARDISAIATNENYTNKQTGEKVMNTEWHNIVVRNKAAEICNKYLKKGDKVYVEGKLKTRKWQGEDGIQRYSTEIHVNEFNFLNNKSDADAPMNPVSSENAQPQTTSENTQNQVDDLPF